MAARFKVSAQLAIVVNLAIENHRDAAVFIESGLFAGEEIDDCEASHPERDAVIDKIAFGVGTAMLHAIAHRAQQFFTAVRRRCARIEVGPTGYAAHRCSANC